MQDTYKKKLRHAAWTWLEGKFCWYHRKPRTKDRVMGRNDKRAARNEDREEIQKELLDKDRDVE
jgi:hypothetical protein